MHDHKPSIRGLESEAFQQGGYFTVPQARDHGVNKTLLNHYVSSGRFTPVRRSLYRLSNFPSSPNDEIREKWLSVGPRSIVSHQSALDLLDLSDEIPSAVHLLVARRDRGMRRPPGVVLHTHPDGEQVPTVSRDGLPVTAPARTLVDVLADIQPDQATRAIRQALERGLITKRQLLSEAMGKKREQALTRLLSAIEE
jgi:predicted transcriptional regulator of viral defense system